MDEKKFKVGDIFKVPYYLEQVEDGGQVNISTKTLSKLKGNEYKIKSVDNHLFYIETDEGQYYFEYKWLNLCPDCLSYKCQTISLNKENKV